MNTLVAALPILVLIWMMVKRSPIASYIALPITALIAALLQLFFFQADLRLLLANSFAGVLSVMTPISIIAGAILLNRMLAISGAETTIKHWLESISSNQVAQLMIIGWAFAFMLEGASGFGTPAAIAAPILVGLGFSPFKVIIFTLILNSIPVSFGAVGTPTWFGFSALNLDDGQVLAISRWTALCHVIAALVIPMIALCLVLPLKKVRQNSVFIYLSVFSCVLPYWLFAQWNYEFPSLIGGAVGLLVTIYLASRGVGLDKSAANMQRSKNKVEFTPKTLFVALFPLLLLIVVLVITRIHQLGIKALLNDETLWVSIHLGFAQFELSKALILSLHEIFGTSVGWSYKTLFVPALIPFVLVVLICVPLLKMSKSQVKQMCSDTLGRIAMPCIALIGALVMVNVLMQGGHNAPIFYMASTFADLSGEHWVLFASYLGALGTFFSGSATVSNLTFGGIQYGIAQQVGLSETLVLALQSTGAAMGNMICISNIIAVASIVGVNNQEGPVLKKTFLPMLIYGAIVGCFSYLFY
ncbi:MULTISPECIES: L-lactate permease [Pseudoalteromonas]|uniref:L-lactate permease n=1 Tax=Pseudoalteromonas TaxID=53246 RepID=UPI000783C86E|nr:MULTISPECIES: L-lactate permease [Pseudoalteromonas]MCO7205917.1 L-lactate permease [Pseudoalteromonas sp. CnMc7-37]